MKDQNKKTLRLLAIPILISLCISCSEPNSSSFYDKDYEIGATPVITTIEYEGKGLAGVTIFTIIGNNFSAQADLVQVYFGPEKGTVLQASTTQLVVKAPYYVGNSLDLKIAVPGALLFSEPQKIDLHEPLKEVYGFDVNFDKPYALTLDADHNIFFSYTFNGAGKGINKISADSAVVTNIGPKKSETYYNGLKYNATDGSVYGVWNGRAIFFSKEGNGTTDVFAAITPNQNLNDLDFDKDINIWTGGNGKQIHSITPSKVITSFDFEPLISSIRVFNDYLYVSGEENNSIQAVWRFAINSADNLGDPELYFDFSAYYSSNINAITFSADGDLFIGTDGKEPIIRVTPDGAHEEWYPGIISGPVLNFAWDTGDFLYYSRGASAQLNQTILKIDLEQTGAAHYGRD